MNDFPTSTQRYVATIPNPDGTVGDPGYWSGLDHVLPDGTIVARISGDATHNHWGVYTRMHPLDDPSGKRVKRFEIEGGTTTGDGLPLTDVTVANTIKGDTRFTVRAVRNATTMFRTGAHTIVAGIVGDEWRVVDQDAGTFLSRVDLTTGEDLLGCSPIRELASPTVDDLAAGEQCYDTDADAMVFKRADGTLRWWPCGTP